MQVEQAHKLMQKWFTAPKAMLEDALKLLIEPAWLEQHPELFIHPRDLIDERTLGVHQSWDCNLMPYRELQYDGRTIYLFDHHVQQFRD